MRLGNRYLLLSRIATGGMGEVWRARDELLGREVAVKTLRSHIHADPSFRERFRNEARITAALTDPGIAQIYDYGEQSDGAYLVMELVHGESLSAILARNGSLGPDVTLDVLHQTAKALHAAHSSGVVHRDIKPGNLLVTPEGTIKVTDFGIARALEAAPVTQAGTVLGTAQYVSPEQAQGLPLTPATDLYSLGIVAYECLAGRTPFQGDSQVAIALRHLNEQPPPLGVDVPAPVRELVKALLAKDPAARPGSARELADRAYVLRETPADAGRSSDLSMLTDPAGFRVHEPRADSAEGEALAAGGLPETAATRAGASGGTPTRAAGGGAARHVPRRRGRGVRVLASLVATAGCLAVVGLGAMTLTQQQLPARPPDVAEPSGSSAPPPTTREPRPAKTKTRTRRPPVVPVKSQRPVPSRSATVTRSATPTRKPTPKPTPSAPTPTPTPTPTPPTTTPTPTTSASPDPGDTNPPKGET
ncbi:serine/threonine-protein kinase [Nonomuraea muscovyensis]|uniref:non-specific serine/threonine protein kinase n=1 Tax=Nonomuraea muscovyensis TaxID=1124761 RepID=A0A7X0C230_9ACTN|nr:serine/threonine-protein kinase [Nonomuraea muscovyensis]MBB6346276.1 serine/threonine-protein kinase [Nonomuraea muscovyensis]